jgi:KipI family sensor histidine kinase inhibitor
MKTYSIVIKPFGENAVLIEWPNKVEESILQDILQYCNHLKSKCLDLKSWELIPAYNSLLLLNKYEKLDFKKRSKELKAWYTEKKDTPSSQGTLWKLPVCYDMEFGIDQEELSGILGLSTKDLIDLHTSLVFTVYGIGFLPGFMYLGGLPASLETPRKATPRLDVKKGSVGLAGKQTGIYPQDSPGGWNIIGNCPIPIFNVEKEEPCFVKVGDKIQFYEITRKEHELHSIEANVGIYNIEKISLDA